MKKQIKKHPLHLKRGLILIVLGAVLLLISYWLFSLCRGPKICYQGYCFLTEIADTVQTRQQGLMFRKSLPHYKGMLFVFDRLDIHGFWMKNTLIPLDIIWLDSDYTIVDIKSALPCTQNPCKVYFPKVMAKYVLEIPQGLADDKDMTIGQKMDFISK